MHRTITPILVVSIALASTVRAQTPPGQTMFEDRCGTCNGGDGNGGERAPAITRVVPNLQDARLASGAKPQVVDLPMPAPLVFDGRRLPASYANFYIANAAVLVPTFNDPNDRIALGILAELIRDRAVVGIHAVELVWGLGTLHCLTQQQPTAGS